MPTTLRKPIKAFLLAGGLGTRLRPLTDATPKCLLPIHGKPLLQHWMENLAAAGVSEALVNTHWLSGQVEAFLADFQVPGLTVKVFHEPELLGSAGTLAANADWAMDASAVAIIYADNYTDSRVSELLDYHFSQSLPFTLGVFRTPHPERCGIVEVDETGVVTSFVEKPAQPRSNLAAGGMYITDPATLMNIKAMAKDHPIPFELGFHVLPSLVGRMRICHLSENLIDIGTIGNYKLACSQDWN